MRLTLGLPVDTLGPARPAPAPRGFAAPVAHCGGRMKLRALVRDRESIERLPPSPGPVDRAAGPGRGTAAALLPLRNPPQADQPGRAVRVGRSAPPQGRGLPTEGSLWDSLQVKGRGFILMGRQSIQVWPSPSLHPSVFHAPHWLKSVTLRRKRQPDPADRERGQGQPRQHVLRHVREVRDCRNVRAHVLGQVRELRDPDEHAGGSGVLRGAVSGWEDGGGGGTAGWARVIGLPIWVEGAAEHSRRLEVELPITYNAIYFLCGYACRDKASERTGSQLPGRGHHGAAPVRQDDAGAHGVSRQALRLA